MRQKSGPPKETSDQVVKDIRRATSQKSGHLGNVGQHGSDAVKRRGKPIVGA
jgi:hypothetical protein